MKGWNSSKHPILTANQMPAPIHWNPMNEDWKMRLTKSQIYNTSSGFDTQTRPVLLWQQLYEERPGLPVPLQFCTALV